MPTIESVVNYKKKKILSRILPKQRLEDTLPYRQEYIYWFYFVAFVVVKIFTLSTFKIDPCAGQYFSAASESSF